MALVWQRDAMFAILESEYGWSKKQSSSVIFCLEIVYTFSINSLDS